MNARKLPKKYQKLWTKCEVILKKGRIGDVDHAREIADFVLSYRGRENLEKDILIPVAMLHDIGHAAILPEHFDLITGPKKLVNGKLVHMLVGAKIAKDILDLVGYNKTKIKEIVDIVSMHDSDQLEMIDTKKIYNTKNKRIFHDIDSLDRYTETRLENVKKMYKDKKEIRRILKSFLSLFFIDEFKKIAESRLARIL